MRVRRGSRFMTLGAVLLVAISCGSPGPVATNSPITTPAWRALPVTEMSAAELAQRERGLAAQRTMAGRLKAALIQAVDEGGPDAAITVCHEQAPRIAAELAASHQLRIGRTSMRLRNPENLPPEWAGDLVADRVADPTWLVGPDGRIAGLLPIRLQPECEMCHGQPDSMAEEVSARIAEHYPKDQAVGFTAGDLRGWFWVEVPAAQPGEQEPG